MFCVLSNDEDGTNRRENITDWALNEFRTHYGDANITKWDIFHYVYAVLHHPEYRTRYAANLKRELPRIPFVQSPVASCQSPERADPSLRADALARDDNPKKCAGERSPSTPAAQGAASAQDDTPARVIDPTLSQKMGKDGAPTLAQDDTRVRTFDPTLSRKMGKDGAPALSQDDTRVRIIDPTLSQKMGKDGAPASSQGDAAIFWRFAEAGRRLAELHVNYEQQAEYPLERVEKGQLNYRVEKMRLSKDKTTLTYNDFLTLKGIPTETYEYRLGNRSALEWVVDQYQVSTDKRSGIVNDPNRDDDPEYIVRLIGQVITVSLETMKIMKALPEWAVAENETGCQEN